MSKIRLTNTPGDLAEIRNLLSKGEIDSDQALELLKQLREKQTPPAIDRRKSNA
jgi:hypothetical protein